MTPIYTSLRIYDPDKSIKVEFDRNGYLQRCVKNKTVLHVGCSDYPITAQRIAAGTLLHTKLRQDASQIVGIDISAAGIETLKCHGYDEVLLMDAEDVCLDKKFDTILAGDVLEHTNNPGKFVERAATLLAPGGELIIGVPSALSVNSVRTWLGAGELVHRDHTFYFSPKTLAALCARYGLAPTRLRFTTQAQDESESGLFVRIRKLILLLFPFMSPSLIMHFRKAEEVSQSTYVTWK